MPQSSSAAESTFLEFNQWRRIGGAKPPPSHSRRRPFILGAAAGAGSAMHLLQLADVEKLGDIGGHRLGVAAAVAGEYGGAIVLHVDYILSVQHSRLHPMIYFGEVLEVLAPAGLEFPQLPQLAFAVERH